MKMTVSTIRALFVVLLAMVSSMAASNDSLEQDKRVIDVLVVATDEAINWAGEKAFSCLQIAGATDGAEFDWLAYEQERKRSVSNVVNYYQDIGIEDIKHHISKIDSLFGLRHPCLENSALGNLQPDSSWTKEEKNLVYTHNLIQISLAETNKIFVDSGINNVEFRLVGWELSKDDSGLVKTYPDINGYRSFGKPWPKHANVAVELSARVAKSVSSVRGEVASLRNLSYRGQSTQEKTLDRVHQYRLDHEADVVILLTRPRKEIIGEASWIGVESADNAYAWASIAQATAPQYTFAHELAHLLGAGHYGNENVLGASFDTFAPVPDFDKDEHGHSFVDNQGFIGEYVHKTADGWEFPFYYGTLLSKYGDCQGYVSQLESPLSPSPCHGDVEMVFNYNYIFLPVISNIAKDLRLPSGERLALGRRFSRNNARTMTNAVDRFMRFNESFTAKKMDPSKKIGIDFGRKFQGWTDYRTKSDSFPFWNNMTNPEPYRAYDNLIYQDGSRSGIRAVISGGFEKNAVASTLAEIVLSEGGAADMPVMAMTDGFSTRTRAGVKIENLKTDGSTYQLRLFSSASVYSLYRPAKITVIRGSVGSAGGEKGKNSLVYSTQLNTNQFFVFEGVVPDEDGSIELEISPFESISIGNKAIKDFAVNLNALEIFEDTNLDENFR